MNEETQEQETPTVETQEAPPVETAASTDNTFTLDGKSYQVLSGAILPELGPLTPAEIAADEEVQKTIVAIPGQNIVKEIA